MVSVRRRLRSLRGDLSLLRVIFLKMAIERLRNS